MRRDSPASEYNGQLRDAFQTLFRKVIGINPNDVLDALFENSVTSTEDNLEWNKYQGSDKMRQVLFTLFRRQHPTAFIELRNAIAKEPNNSWLVDEIDKLCDATAGAGTDGEPDIKKCETASKCDNPSLSDQIHLNHCTDDSCILGCRSSISFGVQKFNSASAFHSLFLRDAARKYRSRHCFFGPPSRSLTALPNYAVTLRGVQCDCKVYADNLKLCATNNVDVVEQ